MVPEFGKKFADYVYHNSKEGNNYMIDIPCKKPVYLNNKAIIKVKFRKDAEIMKTENVTYKTYVYKDVCSVPIYNEIELAGGTLKSKKKTDLIGDQIGSNKKS